MQQKEEEYNDCKDLFDLFDHRGDQKIAASQLGDVLRALGHNPTEQEIRKCGYSSNPDARISFETFFPIQNTISKNRPVAALEDFIEGFRVFDKDQNGTIASAELRHILTSLGEKLTEEECDQLLAGQEDSQGCVNYEEFIKVVMNG
ncbi:myosin-2 essential light chain-like [Physella acuta]|uniref:myosin-2 essential light chain-like n=1 Tax=Physella acuta TaxID=109671 RepID=UPI0027DB62D0|nr:myosin-2 essential light chain-like [Physella acuta]